MITLDIRKATTRLLELVGRAIPGGPFVIARADRRLVEAPALGARAEPQRLGFLAGEIAVPDDFDSMGEREIAALVTDRGLDGEADGKCS